MDNNASFAIRMVNASTGTDCVDTTGAIYNNTSGSWTLDNVVIQGQTIDIIATGTLISSAQTRHLYNSPAPTTLGYGSASVLGMNNSYNGTFSTNSADVLAQAGASTGSGGAGLRENIRRFI